MLKRVATFAVLLLFSGIGAWAGTYYVSTSGNDANAGSQASPWLTQQHALNVMQPGDTTLVEPGIYTNAYLFKTMTGGSANLPITLRANGPVTNSITGFEIDNPWFILDGFIWDGISQGRNNVAIYFTTNGSYSQVINNTIQHTAGGMGGIGWLYLDPDASGIRRAGGSCNCLVSNNTLVDLKGAQVFSVKGTNNLVVKNLVRDIQTCDLCYADGAYITYRQNVFTNVYNVEGMGVHPDCMQTHADLFWEESYNVVIERNTFVDCSIALSQLTADLVGWANISNATMGAYTVNAQIPGESVAEPLLDPMFVKVSTSSGGFIATNGSVVTIKGTPVSGSSLIVSNSGCVGTTGWMELDGGTRSTNIVGVNNSNWHIRNNRFIRCGNGGIGLGVASIDLPQCYWYNNLFYECCTNVGGVLNFAFYSTNLMSRGISTNGGAWNNAFISCGDTGRDGWWNLVDVSEGQGVSSSLWNMFCDYNLVVDWNGSGWVAKAGFTDAHGLNLGTDPRVGDYRPMWGSPLIGAGTNYMGVSTNDYEGWARPASGACDIGALQFDTNLVVYFDFDGDLTQNKIQDVSGYSHDAINFNLTNWITAAPGVFWDGGQWTVVGVMTNDPGQTYNLSQYAGITNLTGINFITNGTISVWVQWATNAERWDTILDAGYQRAYSAQPSLATNSWALHYGSANLNEAPVGPIFKLYSDDLNNPYTLISWTQPRDGSNWWHIAVTWTATNDTVVGYQNGQPMQTNSLGGAQYLRVSGSPTPPWIAVGAMQHDGTPQWGEDKYPNSGFFKGKMDDLRIYNRPLSAAEVQNLYAGAGVPMQGAAPPGDPPPGDSPVITAQPQGATIAAGGSVTFSVAATGISPLVYQWLLNGEGIAGATASTYVDNDVQPDDAGLYSVVISNPAGSVTSSSATLSVITPPVISAQPQSLVVTAGASAAFSVDATGGPPLAYQWLFNGATIPGATASAYTKNNAQPADAGNYSVTVSNVAGAVGSTPAVLTVTNSAGIASDSSLKLHFTFDQGFANGRVADVSGNGNDGWQFNPTNWITAVSGVLGGTAAQFSYVGLITNGSGEALPFSQYIAVTNLAGIAMLTNATISFWARFDTNSDTAMRLLDNGYSAAYAADPSAASNSWSLGRNYGACLSLLVYPSGGTRQSLVNWPNDVDASSLSSANFHLYAVTLDCPNNRAIAYYDGASVMTNGINLPWIRVYGGAAAPWLCVGAACADGVPQWGSASSPHSGFMAGGLGDLRIYNRALSAGEVGELFSPSPSPSPGPSPPRNLVVIPIRP